jgi:hypothetical protein
MHPIDTVQEGMHVVDSTGKHAGKVFFVKLGDPEAVTPQGEEYLESPTFLEFIRKAFDSFEEIDPERAEELQRIGYIEVDTAGPGRHKYYASDEIAAVDGATVRLSIPQHTGDDT